MHTILDVQEIEGVSSLNQARVHRCWSLDLEGVCRAELLLISYEDNLLGIESTEEGFVLLNHGRLIHNHSLELFITELLSACFTDGRHNYL